MGCIFWMHFFGTCFLGCVCVDMRFFGHTPAYGNADVQWRHRGSLLTNTLTEKQYDMCSLTGMLVWMGPAAGHPCSVICSLPAIVSDNLLSGQIENTCSGVVA